VVSLPRVGKVKALTEGVRRARGEVLVFTDANTMLNADALRALAQNFADPEVGGVAGATGYIVSERAEASGRGEDLYWRYDTWLKTRETLTGSVVSAHGGLYAIRRELFDAPADPAVTDDFAISSAVVAAGRRLVFEPAALGLEHTMTKSASEFSRRVRLMTRGLRGVLHRRALLDPRRHGFYAVALFSHKVLRRLLPLLLLPLLVSSLALAPRAGWYAACAVLQSIFYVLALTGWWMRGSRAGRHPELYVPFFYCLSNLAALAALWNVVRGRRIDRWTPQRHEGRATSELASTAAEAHAKVERGVT
jgi:cellulose synthase/poly-beta-1,6-N-acetylglucosamine synthase-like glycosyltransferase